LAPVEKGTDYYNTLLNDLKSVGDYTIQMIEAVQHKAYERLFHGCIQQVEQRESEPEFQPRLDSETNKAEREKVLQIVSCE
jgi:hypothetical protein